MKKGFLALIGLLTLTSCFFYACSKEETGSCTGVSAASEKPAMISFANSNGIAYTEHSSGMLYQIMNPGAGLQPNLNSRIFVTYKGTLLNGKGFDSSSNPGSTSFILRDLIQGWQIGLQQIRKGGTIKMIIPSSLGYGCNPVRKSDGTDLIPANSPLYFEMTLWDVQ
jgi:FKBP-type peptidyl-prolyl cis-trans isomerase